MRKNKPCLLLFSVPTPIHHLLNKLTVKTILLLFMAAVVACIISCGGSAKTVTPPNNGSGGNNNPPPPVPKTLSFGVDSLVKDFAVPKGKDTVQGSFLIFSPDTSAIITLNRVYALFADSTTTNTLTHSVIHLVNKKTGSAVEYPVTNDPSHTDVINAIPQLSVIDAELERGTTYSMYFTGTSQQVGTNQLLIFCDYSLNGFKMALGDNVNVYGQRVTTY